MTKLLLILAFVAAISVLGFAAANAGPPTPMLIDGHLVEISYD